MTIHVVDLRHVDRTMVAVVGGKGAHLGELTRIDGIHVPMGFCVTTAAFQRFLGQTPTVVEMLDAMSKADASDRETISTHSTAIRSTLEASAVPDDVAENIATAISSIDERAAWAVRSSATAEDSADASFAGQHDTWLDVVGTDAVVEHVRRCWASLFTDRAVTYRIRHGVDHRTVHMAVVVQELVRAQVSGILFTADPVTGNRRVSVIEATPGLGEALVAGHTNADALEVRDGTVMRRTAERVRGGQRVLADADAVHLADLGRSIEQHFGQPQDIEWCLADGTVHVVQSRPITTLFPIPDADDDGPHVYVSVGHQQMMTDPIKPLGLSVWQLTSPAPMRTAGGRLFVDVTAGLSSPARSGLVAGLGRSDPLIGDALQTVLDRGFLPPVPDSEPTAPAATGTGVPAAETDPELVVELMTHVTASIAALKRDIATKTGTELIDFILADLPGVLRQSLFDPRSLQVITAVVETTWWLNDNLAAWLGEKNAADTLSQSVPDNVTAQMGLALLDVADVIRPHPEIVTFLEQVEAHGDDEDFLEELDDLDGGSAARAAIAGFLDSYGMRCVGEIDITRPRWAERPSALVPVILTNVRNFEPGEAERRFERGRQEALAKERELLERLRALPDGDHKAAETKAMIDRLRTFVGYREFPKYAMVSCYFVYKQALLEEAERLAHAGVLREPSDIFFLSLHELRAVVANRKLDHGLVEQRKRAFRSYHALTPPRVLTSDGEAIAGRYRRDDVPDGALTGLAVSSGIVEGRARVIRDIAEADLEPGDILVTAHTDPSWSPLFVTAAGLVTEVGGLMTHGAVIAREYGLPAVIGVERATRLIRDRQRVLVNGTDGYVEVLERG